MSVLRNSCAHTVLALVATALFPACRSADDYDLGTWSRVAGSKDNALMGVHGSSADDVWLVGADHGKGPLTLHYTGGAWQRVDTGGGGDLWWVHALPSGTAYFGGANAQILRFDGEHFERQKTPGLGKHTIYGIWAASASDVYAVGSAAGRNGFIWHSDGSSWSALELPADLPQDEFHDVPAFFKVWGTSASDVWVVGDQGVVLRGNARDGFGLVRSQVGEKLFTVHANNGEVVIAGSGEHGVVLESHGNALLDASPSAAPLLQGACVAPDDSLWVTGLGGSIYHQRDGRFEAVNPNVDFQATQSLHTAWVDPHGGFWAVGGNVLLPSLDAGVAVHHGPPMPALDVAAVEPAAPVCPANAIDPAPQGSIARRWNEQLLNAIRRDVPRPTVHARNLFHTSVAMWDAWAAYDAIADGYVVNERHTVDDVDTARNEAISYAVYRVLSHRYGKAVGGPVSQACFDAFMQKLGFDANASETEGDTPRALGNRIGQAVIAAFANDGANEDKNYASPETLTFSEPNLVVDVPGTSTQDPFHWQRLVIAQAVTQNGIPQSAGAQDYVGPHWGAVTPFALERPAADAAYADIGSPPLALDDTLVEEIVTSIRKSAELDIDDDTLIDISPGAYGNNPLASNAGTGHPENPKTHQKYAPERVKRGDFTRVLAEFWADGPRSETPPGHWNTLANGVADSPLAARQLFGAGDALDTLSWDVHTYLALNGAVHDAAIAAWELKRKYQTARPITLVRYFGAKGQRSDPNLPSYDAQGLPLIDGVIELITQESSAPGERHAHLARYVGELAVRSWRGEPGDRVHEHGGVGWVRVREWMPYQRRNFVTPAFPGYVSGHSTFSRAAATVLATLTGDDFFPGGLATFAAEPGYLVFEQGPSARVELQWATYFDAADQAGQSRIIGGIHVQRDDFDGRLIGALVGTRAIDRARSYFDGSAVP